MSSETPTKEELASELQRVLTTLTEEAQRAAVRKVSELGFDPNKGRISLEETLITSLRAETSFSTLSRRASSPSSHSSCNMRSTMRYKRSRVN